MNDVLYITLMGLLTLVSTIIGSGLTDARKHWHKSLKPKGKVVLYIGLGMLGLSIWQYISTKAEEKKEKLKAAEERRAADKAMEAGIKKGIDSGLQQISKGLGTSFREQGFKMDSMSFQLSAIRDSARIVKTGPEILPVIGLESDGISMKPVGNRTEVEVNLKALQSGATNFNLKFYTLIRFRNGIKESSYFDKLIDYDAEIPQDLRQALHLNVNTPLEIDTFHLYITGTYTGIGSNKLSTP